MIKNVTEYTIDELSAKIEAIKAERERTANALKRYEEELEHRTQGVPLGVPCDGKAYVSWNGKADEDFFERKEDVAYNAFSSYESAKKHAEMLLDWRKDGLVANAKGESIDIKVLLPLVKKGYVAMDEDERWYWHKDKPTLYEDEGTWRDAKVCYSLFAFNIKPAEDWRESSMECGL